MISRIVQRNNRVNVAAAGFAGLERVVPASLGDKLVGIDFVAGNRLV